MMSSHKGTWLWESSTPSRACLGRDNSHLTVMEISLKKGRKKLPSRDIPPLQTQVKKCQLIHMRNPHLLQLLRAKSHKQTLSSALTRSRVPH
jgi:hypothetical protein